MLVYIMAYGKPEFDDPNEGMRVFTGVALGLAAATALFFFVRSYGRN